MERLTRKTTTGNYTTANCTVSIRDVFDKMGAYEDDEEQGLLLKLPCKVGNIIYEIEEDRLSSTMKTIEFEGQEYHRHIPNYFINTDIFTLSKIDKFGKTVFLTKEEAEQVLKQIGE